MKRVITAMGAMVIFAGCSSDQASNLMDSMGKLRGAHAARGGVNLDSSKGGDWQVSSCDKAANDALVLSASNAKDLLTVRLSAPKGAMLRLDGGNTLRFTAEQCRISTKPKGDEQWISVDCTGGGHEVIAGVTTLRCEG